MEKILRFAAFSLIVAAFAGCTKDRYYRNGGGYYYNNQPGNAASNVGTTLANDADGIVNLVGQVTLSAQNMVNANSACGTIRSDSTVQQNPAGATTTYKYINKNKLVVLCKNSTQADSAVNTSSYTGTFSNTNVVSSNSGSSLFNIGGILATATYYTVDGTYVRQGNYQYNNTSQTATTSNINITLKKLLVSKPNRYIVGGTATFTITGTDTNAGVAAASGNYSYTGTLTFNTTNLANLTLNGVNYTVNLTNGAVNKV
ncbi:hypothetical protein [Mucilaginibacter ginkgonis]|uniref:Lipoprotein n=1 Tax=Mucilaginibacter ginkgonis TaxID=2682091 RepID=A0A6I4HZD4_9SPHI|nr:hypothetical protein [Mucilaginibacter ginkgonis]QQL50061.1 hypothetical protein GO620_001005 [Mucilaginibacter ginkgonis]